MHPISRRTLIHAAALAPVAAVTPGWAQGSAADAYPDKPIKIVVGFVPGGILDIGARMIGEELTKRLKQAVVVENRPGAGAISAISSVLSSRADGYTLLLHPISSTSKAFFKSLPFNPLTDLQPVSPVWRLNSFFLVNSTLPVKTLAEFVAYAKAHPNTLNSGSSFIGGQIWNETFKKLAGIDMTSVPYKGTGAVVPALISNDIQACVDGIPTYMPFVKEGKVRVLAYFGQKRFDGLPDVPTITEAGYPQLSFGSTIGFWTKAGTPPAIVAKLNQVINEIVALPSISSRISSFGASPDIGSAEDFRQRVEKETGIWAEAAKGSGYEPV